MEIQKLRKALKFRDSQQRREGTIKRQIGRQTERLTDTQEVVGTGGEGTRERGRPRDKGDPESLEETKRKGFRRERNSQRRSLGRKDQGRHRPRDRKRSQEKRCESKDRTGREGGGSGRAPREAIKTGQRLREGETRRQRDGKGPRGSAGRDSHLEPWRFMWAPPARVEVAAWVGNGHPSPCPSPATAT